MKIFTTVFLILSACSAIAQIKFSEKTFENGMVYPVAHIQGNQIATDSMNVIIKRNLIDAAVSDFCIGDYGYFQKGNHIELHLVSNCIDFEQTEHKYLFFNLETGLLVDYTDLFDEKELHRALKEINRQARDFDGADNCQTELGGKTEDLDWSFFDFRLYKDGLEVSHVSESCSIAFPIPWPLLNSYLKFRFL